MQKTTCSERGLCCDSCQEEVNCGCCAHCGLGFNEGEIIYCEHLRHEDCKHYHERCKPDEVLNGT